MKGRRRRVRPRLSWKREKRFGWSWRGAQNESNSPGNTSRDGYVVGFVGFVMYICIFKII